MTDAITEGPAAAYDVPQSALCGQEAGCVMHADVTAAREFAREMPA